jgi:dTDP-4-dehydrorhamnose 3,5-epimerase
VRFQETDVQGAYVVHPEFREDDRGSFARIFCGVEFEERGLSPLIAQMNLATTARAGTVRGLHYQLWPAAEAKLVRCVHGAIFDVVVDLRADSPTLGRWFGVELGPEGAAALYVPAGCAHGYQALTDGASALYQASAPYTPELERGLHHADPAIGIAWPLPPVQVSEKDRSLPPLDRAQLVGTAAPDDAAHPTG